MAAGFINAAMPYVQAALPYVVDAVGDYVSDYLSDSEYSEGETMLPNQIPQSLGLPPTYTTNQADESLRSNAGLTAGATAQQLALEEQMRQQRAANDLQRQVGYENMAADRANAAVNANVARDMALQAQQALNNQYTQAGARLNSAAAATQNALNSAGANINSLFRG